jgi:hypothetical protein
MVNKDTVLLEKAYLAVRKPMVGVPSDEPNEDFMDASVDPSLDGMEPTNAIQEPEVSPSVEPNAVDVVSGMPTQEPVAPMVSAPEVGGEEDEEHEMAINNLNSIRESIVKIASHCATGEGLEAWAQQKLAIAMDNLASVARSLGTHCRG